MKQAVAQAIAELRAAYPKATVTPVEDGSGGAFVTVSSVPLGPVYEQAETWIGFHVTYSYPYADVYPHFVRPDLRRIDGAPLGDAGNPGRTGVWTEGQRFQDRPAIMLSRRSNDCTPSGQTALQKLQKVLQWLNDRQ